MCFQRHKTEICDRPGVRLRLKVRLLKAEVIETLLYGCKTWSLNKPDYDSPRRVHQAMLLRCLGWRKRKRDGHTPLYADALAKTASESIEAIVRKRRIPFGGFVARMGEERLPQRVMSGELVGGKGYSGGQEKDWMVHLKEDIRLHRRPAGSDHGDCCLAQRDPNHLSLESWLGTILRAGSLAR